MKTKLNPSSFGSLAGAGAWVQAELIIIMIENRMAGRLNFLMFMSKFFGDGAKLGFYPEENEWNAGLTEI
jgi:hypothetical protein